MNLKDIRITLVIRPWAQVGALIGIIIGLVVLVNVYFDANMTATGIRAWIVGGSLFWLVLVFFVWLFGSVDWEQIKNVPPPSDQWKRY